MRKLLTLGCAAILALSACSDAPQPASGAAAESPYFLASDHQIDVDGVTVRYRDEGPSDAPVLVMIHGSTASLESWDALTDLMKTDYRIVRMDLPGHGLTGPDPQERYTNEDTVEFLGEFLDAANIENPVLVGNSLGGLVAWRYARHNPDNVDKLVLIAPGGFSINGVTEEPVDVPMMVRFFVTNAPRAGVKAAYEGLFADPSKLTDARIDTARDMMLQPGNGEAMVKRLEVFTLPEPTADLGEVPVQTLIIWGDADATIPVDHADRFVNAMPNAELITYNNAGHMPQEEVPGQVADDMRRFLSAE